MSHHVWRQTFTASVAVNFLDESMNILKPRVNHRKNTEGVTGMQFPLYEWTAASLFRVFGKDESVFRYLSIILFLFTVCGFFTWTRDWFGIYPAFVGSAVLLWSPELYYHSVNPLPDIMALFFAIFACKSYFLYYRTKRYYLLPFSFILLTLAGLIKIHFLLFGGLFFLPFWRAMRHSPIRMSHQIGYALMCLSGVGAWYAYAIWLRSVSGLKDVGLYTTPANSLSEGLQALKGVIISDFPEQLIGYASLVVLVIGYALLIKNQKFSWMRIAYLPLIICALVYFYFELGQFAAHSYYLIPFIPFAILPALKGFPFLPQKWRIVILLLLMVQPVLSSLRMDHRWQNPESGMPPAVFLRSEPRAELTNAVPDNALTLVGPDESGCIYFYFTNTKGYCAFSNEEFMEMARQADSLGIQFAISPIQLPEDIAWLVEEQGEMKVYQIKLNQQIQNSHSVKPGTNQQSPLRPEATQ